MIVYNLQSYQVILNIAKIFILYHQQLKNQKDFKNKNCHKIEYLRLKIQNQKIKNLKQTKVNKEQIILREQINNFQKINKI
ncbi:hypothetical protein pb186bvf_016505 [Paramecium bursaria]